MKRDKKLLICMTDDEYSVLEDLINSYSIDGFRATKSFLVRYGLKRLPRTSPFGVTV